MRRSRRHQDEASRLQRHLFIAQLKPQLTAYYKERFGQFSMAMQRSPELLWRKRVIHYRPALRILNLCFENHFRPMQRNAFTLSIRKYDRSNRAIFNHKNPFNVYAQFI